MKRSQPDHAFLEWQRKAKLDFSNWDLLRQVFVHRSYLNENPAFPLESNERLEFLGDAALGLIAAALLFERFPEAQEGELTALRAEIVRTEALARLGRTLELGQQLLLGRGEELSGGRERDSLLAAAYEALTGAVFLDQGFEAARDFVRQTLLPNLDAFLTSTPTKDAKSALQELAQAKLRSTPVYELLAATGPAHERRFTVAVRVGNQRLAEGEGRSKQEAEQEAAARALEAIQLGAEGESFASPASGALG